MESDSIKRLLEQADAREHLEPPDAIRIADGVWRLVRGQRRRQIAAGSMAVVVVISGMFAIGVLKKNRSMQREQPLAIHSVEQNRAAELAKLNQQIDLQEKKISEMIMMERLAQVQSRLDAMLPDQNADPIERAAAAVVQEGDRMRDAGLIADASESYGQVIAYFPKTTSAEMAKRRLLALDSKG